ncbi:GlcG/HbpS family heme-binding protein [Sphingosinicella xenopeptidilytica]|uniref:Heme-binding protein n=1 Tax=Sphingosinicella xenopeptidilytica TaxID=364098 RepID=A0ABW3C3S2_SPHXN
MRKTIIIALAVLTLSPPAAAQGPQTRTTISIDMADTLVNAAAKEAETRKLGLAIIVVDEQGSIVLARRMDGAFPHSVEIARRKAMTSALTRQPTKVIQEMVAKGDNLILAIDNMLPIEGGLPVFHDGKIVGAIGVSGSPSHIDAAVAQAGVDALAAHAGDRQ